MLALLCLWKLQRKGGSRCGSPLRWALSVFARHHGSGRALQRTVVHLQRTGRRAAGSGLEQYTSVTHRLLLAPPPKAWGTCYSYQLETQMRGISDWHVTDILFCPLLLTVDFFSHMIYPIKVSHLLLQFLLTSPHTPIQLLLVSHWMENK